MASRGPVFRRLQQRFRGRRFSEVERILRSILSRKSEVTVLDAGGRQDYWLMLPEDLRPVVRIVVLNFGEELDLYDVAENGLRLENVVGDACNMPEFGDRSFDLVHSNSVIEHVGSYQNMARFADEVRRVANAYYVQAPNFWFPIDPHYAFPFVHWLPDNLRIAMFVNFNLGYAKKTDYRSALERVDHTRIVDRRLFRNLFPDGRLINERILLLTKSITAVREFND